MLRDTPSAREISLIDRTLTENWVSMVRLFHMGGYMGRFVAIVALGALAACGGSNLNVQGTGQYISLNGEIRSSGAPHELRAVENGAIGRQVLSRSAAGGPQTARQQYMPASISFEMPQDFEAGRATCLAVVDRLGMPVAIRSRGSGLDVSAFANPLWQEQASYRQTLANAASQEASLDSELRETRLRYQTALDRLPNNRSYVGGQCVAPAMRPLPSRPANALAPEARAQRVEATCNAALTQRLGCNVATNLMRRLGYSVSPFVCGQSRVTVPSDALTPWADLFENSFIQGCVNNGDPITCGLARSAIQSRQQHCRREVARPFEAAYAEWNSAAERVRREPQQLLAQCTADVSLRDGGPVQIANLEERAAAARHNVETIRSSDPTEGRVVNLADQLCTGTTLEK